MKTQQEEDAVSLVFDQALKIYRLARSAYRAARERGDDEQTALEAALLAVRDDVFVAAVVDVAIDTEGVHPFARAGARAQAKCVTFQDLRDRVEMLEEALLKKVFTIRHCDKTERRLDAVEQRLRSLGG